MALLGIKLGETFKKWADSINTNFTGIERDYALKSEAYVLPVGGAELGGVKNGGNVTVNADGTMTAPTPQDGGVNITKVDFTIGDVRWSALTDNVYKLTLPHTGNEFMNIFKESGSGEAAVPVVDVSQTTSEIVITSMDKFAGYVNLIG